MSDRLDIEFALRSVASSVSWPEPSNDLVERVTAGIAGSPRKPVARKRQRLAYAVAAIVILTSAVVLVPTAREAAANLLQAAGIRIGLVNSPTPPPGSELQLGEAVPINELEQMAGFALRLPNEPAIGPPNAAYLGGNGEITLVWEGNDLLPSAGDTGISLLFTQQEGLRPSLAEKSVGSETQVTRVVVEGQPGLWIEGAPHLFTLLDPDGSRLVETARLAANVLLWQAEGINHRIETTGDLTSALAFVESLRPPVNEQHGATRPGEESALVSAQVTRLVAQCLGIHDGGIEVRTDENRALLGWSSPGQVGNLRVCLDEAGVRRPGSWHTDGR